MAVWVMSNLRRDEPNREFSYFIGAVQVATIGSFRRAETGWTCVLRLGQEGPGVTYESMSAALRAMHAALDSPPPEHAKAWGKETEGAKPWS